MEKPIGQVCFPTGDLKTLAHFIYQRVVDEKPWRTFFPKLRRIRKPGSVYIPMGENLK
jgi:hypothetical protein